MLNRWLSEKNNSSVFRLRFNRNSKGNHSGNHNVHNTYTDSQICVRLDYFHSSYRFVTTLILCVQMQDYRKWHCWVTNPQTVEIPNTTLVFLYVVVLKGFSVPKPLTKRDVFMHICHIIMLKLVKHVRFHLVSWLAFY